MSYPKAWNRSPLLYFLMCFSMLLNMVSTAAIIYAFHTTISPSPLSHSLPSTNPTPKTIVKDRMDRWRGRDFTV